MEEENECDLSEEISQFGGEDMDEEEEEKNS